MVSPLPCRPGPRASARQCWTAWPRRRIQGPDPHALAGPVSGLRSHVELAATRGGRGAFTRPWLRSRRLSGLSGAFRPSLVRATRRQHHSGLYRDRLPTPQTYLTPPPHTAGCGRWFPSSVARGAPSGRGTPPWSYFRGTAPPPHPALQRPVDRWIRGGGTCLAHSELIRARREDEALLHHCWDLTSEPAGCGQTSPF